MRTETRVVRQEWGFEIWEALFDDKGKQTSLRQRGAAVHGPEPEDFKRALALADPFAAGRKAA